MKLAALATTVAAAGVMAFASGTASAQFIDYYHPDNWTFETSHDGFLLTDDAPATITLAGPDDGSGEFGWASYLISVPVDGIFSFDWFYSNLDIAGFDPAYYVINETSFFLSSAESFETGSVSVPVFAGDIIGWSVESFDNLFGRAFLEVHNFSAPIPVPEPATLGLLSAGLLLLARRHRSRMTIHRPAP